MVIIKIMNKIKDKKKWFAIYVRSRSEKKVLKQLEEKGIESFLPLITRIKQWSDRKKKVEEPLFRSYLFVNIDIAKQRDIILGIYGVVKFIEFEKNPVIVPLNQINAIRQYVCNTDLIGIDEYEEIKEGELVIIKSGSMKGLTGRFVKINGKHRLIVDIEVVGKTIPINVPRSNVEVYKVNQK